MTVLGKILAILNLVLSLFVGWLIVVNYVTRTNWHTAYSEADKQIKVARQDATKLARSRSSSSGSTSSGCAPEEGCRGNQEDRSISRTTGSDWAEPMRP